MKCMLPTVAILLLFASSCKKNNEEANNQFMPICGTAGPIYGSWSVNRVNYEDNAVVVNGAQLVATQVSGSVTNTATLTFYGSTVAYTPNRYKIVPANPAPGEVAIATSNSNGSAAYAATGNDGAYANVYYLSNGMIFVRADSFWAKSSAGSTDSVQLSVSIGR